MNVSERIKFYREQKNLTVNKLANLSGISQSFLRDIERGTKKPTVETVSLLCEALDITLSDFFDDGIPSYILENDLLQQIYRLTPSQQELLKNFLKELH